MNKLIFFYFLLFLCNIAFANENGTIKSYNKINSKHQQIELNNFKDKAKNTGKVAIIVELNLNNFPIVAQQHLPIKIFTKRLIDLSPSELSARKKGIKIAQQSFLDDLQFDVGNKEITATKSMKYHPLVALHVSEQALTAIQHNPKINAIYSDELSSPSLAQSVPWIGTNQAWSNGYTGAGQTVAVLDTGVQKTHPFLAGKVVSEACYSTNVTNVESLCPGGVTESTALGAGVNCDPDITSSCSHGTHVAGITAGKNDGSIGYSGVAKDATIIAIQVFSKFNNSTDCNGNAPCILAYSSDVIKGLERVFTLRSSFNIASVNMSLGGGRYYSHCDTDPRKPIIDSLSASNIATIISSGNSDYTDSMGAPACISSSISVGASLDTSDSISSYSNIASFISLIAPGSGITSSIAPDSYATWNGTSMAAPHVAGAWALIKQQNPAASVSDILSLLRQGGETIDDTRSGGTVTGMKRINLSTGSSTQHILSVNASGTGSGAITSIDSGINCGSDCSQDYGTGTQVNLLATPSAGSVFVGWGGACSGTGSCSVSMTADKAVSATFNITSITLQDSLDASNLDWVSTGDSSWIGQTAISHDGVDAGQSGVIASNEFSEINTTIVGPGTLTFYWKVSSETNYDFLRVFIDGTQQEEISGEVDWELKTIAIPSDSHIFSITYNKDGSVNSGSDMGWVDQVLFTPSSYIVTPSSISGGSINPSTPQSINGGQTTIFTLTTDIYYSIDSVTGTCNGSLNANIYTTNAIISDCTVMANFTLVDTDSDGLPDQWETQYGLNPSDPSDAALDLDNDGLTNLVEFNANSNPSINEPAIAIQPVLQLLNNRKKGFPRMPAYLIPHAQ